MGEQGERERNATYRARMKHYGTHTYTYIYICIYTSLYGKCVPLCCNMPKNLTWPRSDVNRSWHRPFRQGLSMYIVGVRTPGGWVSLTACGYRGFSIADCHWHCGAPPAVCNTSTRTHTHTRSGLGREGGARINLQVYGINKCRGEIMISSSRAIVQSQSE